MGNRAHVIFWHKQEKRFSPAVYLHWNGGADSVYPFLAELDRRGVRADQEYECARFVQLVGEFFDQETQGGLSLGVTNGPESDALEDLERYDHGDNGIFLVDRQNGTMRRFTSWPGPLREWTPEEVERERRQAYAEDYRQGIADAFEKIAAGRELEYA